MRRPVVTALMALGVLSGGLVAEKSQAMPIASPSAVGVPAGTDLKQNAAVVCGYYGCVRVWRPYYGYYRPYGYYAHPYYRPYPYRYGYGYRW